jgi:hypothetical protein
MSRRRLRAKEARAASESFSTAVIQVSSAFELGHHDREVFDVAGEPVQVFAAFADRPQVGGVVFPEVVGVGHDPSGDVAD